MTSAESLVIHTTAQTTREDTKQEDLEVGNLKCSATIDELVTLMEFRGEEAKKHLDEKFSSVEGLCRKLGVDSNAGLPDDKTELDTRRINFGSNQIPTMKSKNFFQLVLEALKDMTLIILIISAVIALGLAFYTPPMDKSERASNDESSHYAWVEGVAILISVVVVVLVTSINNYTKERQFRNLQSKIAEDHHFSVIRGGKQSDVLLNELVVGDIVQIKYGNTLPVDGVVVRSNELKIDESPLTGESDLVTKNCEKDPMLLSGTRVMEGSGKIVVTAVGIHSQTGIIMGLLGAASDKRKEKTSKKANSKTTSGSPKQGSKCNLAAGLQMKNRELAEESAHRDGSVLQQKLARLAIQIGYYGMLIAGCTVLILVFRFCLMKYGIKDHNFSNSDIRYLIHFIIVGVTVLVVAVPEGLPLAVTLALSYSVKKMMKDSNLVRHLDACETMGNATTICSDKTGTLTTNRMTVVQSYMNEVRYEKTPDFNELDEKTRNLLIDAISINSSYTSQCIRPEAPNTLVDQLGNKTECGLLGFVLELGQEYELVRNANPECAFHKVYTFNSARKSMSTVIRTDDGYRVFTKGASEIIMSKCKWQLGADGQVRPFSEADQNRLVKEVVESMASDGLRTLCLAYRDYRQSNDLNVNETAFLIDTEIDWNNEERVIENLTMIALVGIQDPVRPEVPEAITQCQEAGIVVRMVTGDNINTARSIALKCGILKEDDDCLAIESKEFNQRIRDPFTGLVDPRRFDELWPKLRVLARAQPADKFTLVKGIINSRVNGNREVVAVTGDGTNDAPALKKADVGFAMGIAGTDVAKEACDIILTDDNFTSIVKAVMWGRNVYDSIAKFLQFQLTVNLVASIFVFIGACAIQDTPLKTVQILWVNLIMDTLGSLALATETPTPELLKRKPYGRTSPLISRIMLRNIIGHAIYQLIVLLTLTFTGDKIFGIPSGLSSGNFAAPTEHFTIVFNTFVLMTLFNEINARKIHDQRNVFKGLHRSLIYCGIWLFTFIAQVLIVLFGSVWFSVKPLTDWSQWGVCLGFGVSVLVWHQVIISIPETVVPNFFRQMGTGEEQGQYKTQTENTTAQTITRSDRLTKFKVQ